MSGLVKTRQAVVKGLEQAPPRQGLHGGHGLVANESGSFLERQRAPGIVHEVLGARGEPLDATVRAAMAPVFGFDLSRVQVHTDAQASESAHAVHAQAYTVGQHVVFAKGRYAPASQEGKELLAHELAHVTQQKDLRGNPDLLPSGGRHDPWEEEAHDVAKLRRGEAFIPRNPLREHRLQRLSVGESIGSFFKSVGRLFGPEIDFYDGELKEYLSFLNQSQKIQDDFESDDKARDLVRRWDGEDKVFDLDTLFKQFPNLRPAKLKALLIQEMRSGDFSSDDKKGVQTILEKSSSAQIGAIFNPAEGGASLADLAGLDDATVNAVRQALAESAPAAQTEPPAATAVAPNADAANKTASPPTVDWKPIRPQEKDLKGKTFVRGELLIFVPPGAEASKENKIHLFFTANSGVGEKSNDVLTHGLRGAFEATDWLLIGLPGPEPIGRTIKTGEILDCMEFLGRSKSITKLRMTGHSRGHKGLLRTIMGNEDPTPQDLNKAAIRTSFIDLALVDRVVILDAFFPGGQRALRGALTGGEPGKPKERAISSDKVFIYRVIDGLEPGAADVKDKKKQFRNLPHQNCLAAIGCLRLIQEAIAGGLNLPTMIDAIFQDPSLKATSESGRQSIKKKLLAEVPRQVDLLPVRGKFTSEGTAKDGMRSINEFCESTPGVNKNLDRLLMIVNENNLARFRYPGDPNDFKFDARIAAHHFFVAEIAHELAEP